MLLKISIWPFKVASFAVCWHSKDHMSHGRIYPTSRNTLLVLLRANLGNTCSVWRSLNPIIVANRSGVLRLSWDHDTSTTKKIQNVDQRDSPTVCDLMVFQDSSSARRSVLMTFLRQQLRAQNQQRQTSQASAGGFWHPGTTISIAPPGPPRFARSSHRSRCSAEATSGHVWGKLPGIAC